MNPFVCTRTDDEMISGGAIAVNVVLKVLELRNQASTSRHPVILPLPTALVLTYPALDFNFTSWMSDENLRVLRSEQSSTNVPALRELVEQKDHWAHVVSRSSVIYACTHRIAESTGDGQGQETAQAPQASVELA